MGAHLDSVRPPRASLRMQIARIVVLTVVLVGAVLYLLPRIVDLVATPYRLDAAVEHADVYTPGLHQVAAHEAVTLEAFDALDRVAVSLADVRATDARVAAQLERLVAQITGDLQGTLDTADQDVSGLLASLDRLTARLHALHRPVDGATAAVQGDREALARILREARATAATVREARVSAERSADNVSGGAR